MEKSLCVRAGLAFAVLAAGLSVATLFSAAVSDAQARERDRTLKIKFTHTGEKGEFTFKRNGRYDRAVLDKLNKILRDWRRNEPTRMDPKLFDLIWEVYQKTGSRGYIHVVSGYRSLATNNMLRKRGRGVAKRSRHTQGQAMDFFIPGVPVSKIRKIALKMQDGGVGYYPSSRSPFVHLDTGSVRHWPRMTRKQLAAVFPNGETVHVPSDGKPLSGYKRALAKLGKPGKPTAVAYLDSKSRSVRVDKDKKQKATMGKWLKNVFNGGPDEEEDNSLSSAGPAASPKPETAPDDTGLAGASPGSDEELSPTPVPRAVPSRTRMILVAAAERSQVAAADELAMVALVSAPHKPAASALADPVKAQENDGARFELASLANDDNTITAPDRSALASLYQAAARRAAALVAPATAQEPAMATPVVTASLPASRPERPTTAAKSSLIVASANAAPSQPTFSLASLDSSQMPATAPTGVAAYSPVDLLPVALPKAAPPASNADNAPGSAIEAANALGLMGTKTPQTVKPENFVELAYASASAGAILAPDAVAAPSPRPRDKMAAAARADKADAVRTYPPVTLNAHLITASRDSDGMLQFISHTTTRTRAFAMLERPRPDRIPGLYVAPKTSAEAILPTQIKSPRTDRFAIDRSQFRLRLQPARLARLY